MCPGKPGTFERDRTFVGPNEKNIDATSFSLRGVFEPEDVEVESGKSLAISAKLGESGLEYSDSLVSNLSEPSKAFPRRNRLMVDWR